MDCKHYWVCGQPINGFVESVCRKCGEVRQWETLVSIEHKKSRDLPDPYERISLSEQNENGHNDDLELAMI